MKPNADYLAADVYNALSDRGIAVRQVVYFAGGGWRLVVVPPGGILRGLLIIEYLPATQITQVRLKRLFCSRIISSVQCDNDVDHETLVRDIVAVVVRHVS